MTRADALRALLEKVEAGGPVIEPRSVFPRNEDWSSAERASRGSLDAAKALHEAVPTPGVIMDDETAKMILFGANGGRIWLAWKIKALIAAEDN